ncbi:hypothetical protein BH10ACT11_BH10ACT11_01420 [soil metagenome]
MSDGRDLRGVGNTHAVSVQDVVIEQIRSELGNSDNARFDRALIVRMGELLEIFAESDFETTMLGARALGNPVRNSGRGVAGMLEVVGDWLDAFEGLRAENVELSRVGDSVVMEVLQIATAQGVDISTPSSIVFKFDGETIGAVEFHLDQAEGRTSALAGFSRPS